MNIAGLTFEPIEHVYHYAGERVPSVTQVLDVIDETWRVDPLVLRAAAERGVAVHRATELDDLGDLDVDDLDPVLLPYLQAWRRFRADMGFTVLHSESRVWHDGMRYAGTLDRVGTMGKLSGRRSAKLQLLDIKSGTVWPSHGPQTAAYAEAFQRLTSEKIADRWCVYLRPDGQYRLERQEHPGDWSTFLACLSIRQFRARTAPGLPLIAHDYTEGMPR